MDIYIATQKGQIVIPKKYRNKFGIKKGTKVRFIEKSGELIIKPLNSSCFKQFVGILKGDGDVIKELIKEKSREKKG